MRRLIFSTHKQTRLSNAICGALRLVPHCPFSYACLQVLVNNSVYMMVAYIVVKLRMQNNGIAEQQNIK